jgi:metal-sulfur cluster biosynthetic enzyme
MSSLNSNPTVYETDKVDEAEEASGTSFYRAYVSDFPVHLHSEDSQDADGDEEDEDDDEVTAQEIFELIRGINDPEHPLTLEQLKVVSVEHVQVNQALRTISVQFTPTIPHCSMATLIGLSLQVKLLRSLPRRFKIDVSIFPNTHASEGAINKQLNDKERVTAALENHNLLQVVNKCVATSVVG